MDSADSRVVRCHHPTVSELPLNAKIPRVILRRLKVVNGRGPALIWICRLSERLEAIRLIRTNRRIIPEISPSSLCGKGSQTMIKSEFADPVLSVKRGNLSHGDGVVVEAKPIRGKSVQTFIDDSSAAMQYRLVIESVRYTKPGLKIIQICLIEIFLRILRTV